MRTRIFNRRGLSLIELTIASGLAAVLVLGAAQLLSIVTKQKLVVQGESWLEIRRTEIIENLKNDFLFQGMVTLNGAPMTCLLADPTDPTNPGCQGVVNPASWRNFKILVSGPGTDSLIELDGNSNTIGFDSDGTVCNTFDTGDASGTCIYGIDLKWRLECAGSAQCRNPEAVYNVNFHFKSRNPALTQTKNMGRFAVSVVRGQRLNTLWETCEAMGGTFTPPATCAPPAANCPTAGDYVIGFDAAGLPVCRSLDYGTCPLGQAMMGFNADGTVICGAGCP